MNTKRIKCTCEHKYQDMVCGKGIRVANKTTKSKGTNQYYYRCTVCLKEV